MWTLPPLTAAARGAVVALLLLLPAPAASQAPVDRPCDSAESCFAAAILADPGGNGTAERRMVRLREIQQRYPGSVWARRAGLLIGILSVEWDPAEAVRFLRTAQRDFPILEDYLRLWKGEALLRMGDVTQAAWLFESIPDAVPDTALEVRAAYRAGEAWYRAGDCPKAADWLMDAVTRAAQDPAAADALLMVADCQLRAGQPEGHGTLRRVWVRYPQTQAAREAMDRLVKSLGPEGARPSADDLYERAMTYASLALYQEAVGAFRDFLAASAPHGKQDEARLKLGIALARLKRYEEAQTVFRELAARPGPEGVEALLWLARVYLRQEQGDLLLGMRRSAATRALSDEQKAALLLLIATWQQDHDQLDAALATLTDVIGLEAGTTPRAEAGWRIGWIQYQRGRYQEAADVLQGVLAGKDRSANDVPQLLYWRARALERLGDPAAARYEDLCRRFPLTYYCLLARSRAGAAPSVGAPVGNGAGQGEAEGHALRRDGHYRKAIELKLLGLDQDAGRELAALNSRPPRDRTTALELSTLLSEVGAHHQALRMARLHFGDMLEQSGEAVPAALWNIAYPTGYLPRIRLHAGARVDPYLVAAIIREESQYDPRAVSRSGALGLMQLLPATAQTMARQQGLRDVSREELFDHETNIRFGTGYLAQMLERFEGNVVQAVAAYNAGPAAVSGWLAKHGKKEVDEFVESIPYQETRQYVKRVVRSYREYRRLGRLPCAAPSLDKVC
jgi:soluble lytic murein transglycosylase